MKSNDMKNNIFSEPDEYVDDLVSHATERAIKNRPIEERRRRMRRMGAWGAATGVVIMILETPILSPESEVDMMEAETDAALASASPLDDFLSGVPDDETQYIAYYDIDEIPEY